MRYCTLGLLVLVSCGASEVQSQRLQDGSYKFTCELSMDECIRRVQTQCKNERFRILEGTSETRLRDAPPFQRAYRTSRVHLVCTDAGTETLLSVDASDAGSKPKTGTCAKGETRACVGPGACQGGQACLADGSGFGSCDCGGATSAPAAPPANTSPPPAGTLPGGPTNPGGTGSAGGPAAPSAPMP